jgi:hypothetical protein
VLAPTVSQRHRRDKDAEHAPDGWWSMTCAFGRQRRIPGSPAANSKDPMDAAWPKHSVPTGARMYCIVS